jgi:serpin B
VWHRDQFAVKPAFLEQARSSFGATVRALDFTSPAAPATINDWVSKETAGRIPQLIDRIDPLDMMFLVNAMYFKAPWSSPFEEASTRAGNFRRDDGRTVQAQLMTQDGTFAWHQDDESAGRRAALRRQRLPMLPARTPLRRSMRWSALTPANSRSRSPRPAGAGPC